MRTVTLRLAEYTLATVALLLPSEKAACAQTPFLSQAEIELWKKRILVGPYQDDWSKRILPRAKVFRTAPESDTWEGNQVNRPWDGYAVMNHLQLPNRHPGRTRGDGLRDAGLVYAVSGDTSYRDAVRQALLSQASIIGTDFGNRVKWDPSSQELHNNNFEIVNWLRKLAYGYAYIRSNLSSQDRETIDHFFLDAATHWDGRINNIIKAIFPNRYQDDYKLPQVPYNPGSAKGLTHYGGYNVYSFNNGWMNIPATTNAMVAVVGILLDNSALKDHAKRFVKEWLMFNVSPDGTVVDQFRWNDDGDPTRGYMYAGTVIGSIVATADCLARAGDTELYRYTASAGFYGWEGGPKSLLLVLRRFANITIGERQLGGGVIIYASKDSNLLPSKIIGPGDHKIQDTYLAPANLYYKDPIIKKSYTRSLPSSPWSGGYDSWGGDWGTSSGIRFLFGQSEDIVWPYPSTVTTSPPSSLPEDQTNISVK